MTHIKKNDDYIFFYKTFQLVKTQIEKW